MRYFLCSSAALLTLIIGSALVAQEKGASDKLGGTATTHKVAPGFGIDQLLREHDRNKDGFLQRDEVPFSWREHFAHIDTNKDGKLSREELDRGVAYLQPRRRPSDLMFVLIEMTDCDDDCGCEIQRVYDSLRKWDKNNDGKIDTEELAFARKEIAGERVENLFKELDDDKDGKISKHEARGTLRRHFDRLDTNKDGFLSREEVLKAAAEKLPGAAGKEAASSPTQASKKD